MQSIVLGWIESNVFVAIKIMANRVQFFISCNKFSEGILFVVGNPEKTVPLFFESWQNCILKGMIQLMRVFYRNYRIVQTGIKFRNIGQKLNEAYLNYG